MLADVFMDLLYIVGILFLGTLFVAILVSAVNNFKLEHTKSKVLKEIENSTIKAYEKQLNKIVNEFNEKDKDK